MPDVSLDSVRTAVLVIVAFVVATSFHELGHAWVATRLGDSLPRAQGRLTLSPRAHVHPIGTLLLPALAVLFQLPLIAWGRPVQTDPSRYRGRWRGRRGHMLVALAGPAMNLVFAALSTALIAGLALTGVLPRWLGLELCRYLIGLNINLMVFNLIPVPPLDGAAVVDGLLSPGIAAGPRAFLRRWGIVVLFVLMTTPLMALLMWPAAAINDAWIGALLRMVP